MATYMTLYPGNTALQTDLWTLTIAEAEAATRLLRCTLWSPWRARLRKPLRRAKRAKAQTVRVETAHFSTGELSTALYNMHIPVTRAPAWEPPRSTPVKYGHTVGTRKVSRKAQAWYDVTAEEHIRRIEAEEAAAKEQAVQAQAAEEDTRP